MIEISIPIQRYLQTRENFARLLYVYLKYPMIQNSKERKKM